MTALSAVLVLGLGLAACGGGSDGAEPDVPSEPDATPASDADLGRVVALGEEFLLADLLALGITPVASTATVADEGFQGVDAWDTEGIVAYPSYEANLEALAAERADVIVATEFIVDQVGREVLEAAAAEELVVIGDAGGTEQLDELAAAFDRPAEAAALEAELDEAIATASSAVPDGCEVSLGTIYPDRSPAAWVAAPNAAAIVAEEAQGMRALYVALTRATRRLTIVHANPLPEPLRDPAATAVGGGQ